MFAHLQMRLALPVALISLVLPFINALSIPHGLLPRASTFSVPLDILPLGDSITWGVSPPTTGGTNGYRKQLKDRIHEAGGTSNMLGTQHSGAMADNDNEGWPGKTITQLQNLMGPGLAQNPNVILLHIGTNDLNYNQSKVPPYSEAPQRLSVLLDDIITACPDAVLMVAKIIHSKKADTDARIQTYNKAIPDIVKGKADAGHKVVLVDQSVVQASELADDLHPTAAGYVHMGNVWFDAVQAAAKQGLITRVA